MVINFKLTLSLLPLPRGPITISVNLIVTEQFAFLQNSLEKAAFVRLYLVSQGRFPLMGLTDVLSVAIRHHEKDTLAWMILHSLYQARIVSHANTGKASWRRTSGTERCTYHLVGCNCFLNLTSLVLLDTGEALLPQMSSTLDRNQQLQLTTPTLWRWEWILLVTFILFLALQALRDINKFIRLILPASFLKQMDADWFSLMFSWKRLLGGHFTKRKRKQQRQISYSIEELLRSEKNKIWTPLLHPQAEAAGMKLCWWMMQLLDFIL